MLWDFFFSFITFSYVKMNQLLHEGGGGGKSWRPKIHGLRMRDKKKLWTKFVKALDKQVLRIHGLKKNQATSTDIYWY